MTSEAGLEAARGRLAKTGQNQACQKLGGMDSLTQGAFLTRLESSVGPPRGPVEGAPNTPIESSAAGQHKELYGCP